MVNKYGILFQFRLVFVIRSQKTVEVIQIQCFFYETKFCFLKSSVLFSFLVTFFKKYFVVVVVVVASSAHTHSS